MEPDSGAGSPLAVLVHAHNFAIWTDLSRYIVNIAVPHDLYVTLPIDSVDQIGDRERQRIAILRQYPRARVLLMQNRGMDIGGFLHALDYLRRSQRAPALLLKLHTKSEPNWRHRLLDALLRDPATFERCCERLRRDAGVGMVGAGRWIIAAGSPQDPRGHDRFVAPLLAEVGLDPSRLSRQYQFVGGTMFLTRTAPLLTWTDRIDLRDFVRRRLDFQRPRGPGLPHSVERLFGALVTHANQRVVAAD